MDSPNKAVDGPNLCSNSLSNCGECNAYDDNVQINATLDDDCDDVDDDCREGEEAVEVTRIRNSISKMFPQSMPSPTHLNGDEHLMNDQDCESLNAFLPSRSIAMGEYNESMILTPIDTSCMENVKDNVETQLQQQCISPNSVNSQLSVNNSIMMDLSDFQDSLSEWQLMVKSELHRLRCDNTLLNQLLANERKGRNDDVSRLQAELATSQAKFKSEIDTLMAELRHTKAQMIEEGASNDIINGDDLDLVENQLNSSKIEPLVKGKNRIALREEIKQKVHRNEHFKKLSNATAESKEEYQAKLEKLWNDQDTIVEERLLSANINIQDLEGQLEKRSEENKAARVALQAATAEKQDMESALMTKTAHLGDLQENPDGNKSKERINVLRKLFDVASRDRDEARKELRISRATICKLKKSNDDIQRELAELKEEAQKRQVENKPLKKACTCFEVCNEESTLEINSIQEKLEEIEKTATFVLKKCHSLESSRHTNSYNSANMENCAGSSNGSSKGILLFSDSAAETVAKKINDLTALQKRLTSVEKDRDKLRAEIESSKRERDSLSKLIDILKPLSEDFDRQVAHCSNVNEGDEKEIAELKAKLVKAEEAFIKIEVEKCEKLGFIAKERDSLASQVKELEASLLTKNVGVKRDAATAEQPAEKQESQFKLRDRQLPSRASTRDTQDQLYLQGKENEIPSESSNSTGESSSTDRVTAAMDEKARQFKKKLDRQAVFAWANTRNRYRPVEI